MQQKIPYLASNTQFSNNHSQVAPIGVSSAQYVPQEHLTVERKIVRYTPEEYVVQEKVPITYQTEYWPRVSYDVETAYVPVQRVVQRVEYDTLQRAIVPGEWRQQQIQNYGNNFQDYEDSLVAVQQKEATKINEITPEQHQQRVRAEVQQRLRQRLLHETGLSIQQFDSQLQNKNSNIITLEDSYSKKVQRRGDHFLDLV